MDDDGGRVGCGDGSVIEEVPVHLYKSRGSWSKWVTKRKKVDRLLGKVELLLWGELV